MCVEVKHEVLKYWNRIGFDCSWSRHLIILSFLRKERKIVELLSQSKNKYFWYEERIQVVVTVLESQDKRDHLLLVHGFQMVIAESCYLFLGRKMFLTALQSRNPEVGFILIVVMYLSTYCYSCQSRSFTRHCPTALLQNNGSYTAAHI